MAPSPPTPAPDRYAVIGHPIAHSRSPAIHAHFAVATGHAIDYGRIDAAPADFEQVVRGFQVDLAAGPVAPTAPFVPFVPGKP